MHVLEICAIEDERRMCLCLCVSAEQFTVINFAIRACQVLQETVHVLEICAIEVVRRVCGVGHSAEQFAVIDLAIHSIS